MRSLGGGNERFMNQSKREFFWDVPSYQCARWEDKNVTGFFALECIVDLDMDYLRV